MAEPTASIWEVTRLIMDSPGASPSDIARAHGFSVTEVAELLPIFLDNVRMDYSQLDSTVLEIAPPAARPGEDAETHAERYLRELVENRSLDVVGYDTLGGRGAELDDVDPAVLDVPGADGPAGPSLPAAVDSGESRGHVSEEPRAAPDGEPHDDTHEADPQPLLELGEDDPFGEVEPPPDPAVADAALTVDETVDDAAFD
jgi:hypothetical protein